jgi:8-oxo-dGTP diphosphatase/2-hydroxy-dATP diphosphatase
MKKLLTLCIIHKDNKVLLGFKKRGFGEGRWNGFGGKVEKNETIEDSVLREIEEEAGIVPIDLRKRGVFEEMRPQWFSEDEVPFDDMWPDDIHWFPLFIDDKNFKGKFYFKDPDTILEHTLEVI